MSTELDSITTAVGTILIALGAPLTLWTYVFQQIAVISI